MGMDVYGKMPTAKVGEYFSNNAWWWRPLWDYCSQNAPDLIDAGLHASGHHNDGAGLDGDGARILAASLRSLLDSGQVATFASARTAALDALPDEQCPYCFGTGARLDLDLDPRVCNGCGGAGYRRPIQTSYGFDVANVRAFAEFLEASGGFMIY